MTTSNQANRWSDWTWVDHGLRCRGYCMGRYWLRQKYCKRYFTPGVHYAAFRNVNEAVENFTLFKNSAERKAVARHGNERARALVCARTFWTGIDALGTIHLPDILVNLYLFCIQ